MIVGDHSVWWFLFGVLGGVNCFMLVEMLLLYGMVILVMKLVVGDVRNYMILVILWGCF